ncbi:MULTISPECIES: hypothetical protein [Clostridium]|uniref:hypothetical protein n=1 Tax=Clostridium TaxID=1485 RepID=UPI0011C7337F|nr:MULTISPECIES: hypothetical protein [Clostridium]MDB2123913.1 hypothetical protein [Clostridium paraputrificum]MDU4142744.1 hypothetical protein [Clostridium sp.]
MGFYDSVKDVLNIVQKADNIDLYRKVLDLQKDAMDLLEENMMLKEKVRILEEEVSLKKSVKYIADAYYVVSENGETDGPYCRVCWDKDKKLIRMTKGNYIGGQAACMVCDFVARDILE